MDPDSTLVDHDVVEYETLGDSDQFVAAREDGGDADSEGQRTVP